MRFSHVLADTAILVSKEFEKFGCMDYRTHCLLIVKKKISLTFVIEVIMY